MDMARNKQDINVHPTTFQYGEYGKYFGKYKRMLRGKMRTLSTKMVSQENNILAKICNYRDKY